jgi:hypothetical protein
VTLAELIRSLDERGITIEVGAKFVKTGTHAATQADVEAAKLYRAELIRYRLAQDAMTEVLALEAEWAGYPGRRTPELDQKLQRAKAKVLYLLPEDLPWELVAALRPDGTTVNPPMALALEGAA